MRLIALAGLLGLPLCALADQALVVGIEQYQPLVAASTLKGCMNDVNGMAALLKREGFTVTVVVNEKATREGIFGALKKIAEGTKKNERFVFYFAGHGRKSPRFALMPSDATVDGQDISPKELNEAILKIPAASRTVLLDSCFSGGMAAGEMSRGFDEFTPRFYDPFQDRSVKFGQPAAPTNGKDTTQQLEGSSGICYYTAALDSEQSLEATMSDGLRHGLFTFALMQNIKKGKLWSEVHNDVKKTISKRLEKSGRQQNPMISTNYLSTEVLTNAKRTAAVPPGKTLLDVWNLDNPNAGKIALKLQPNQDVLEVGRKVRLEVNVGQEGYLVIVGQVDGRLYQFYPIDGTSASSAAVKREAIVLPKGRDRLFFDTFGADHLKAMLFSTPEAAEALMRALSSSQGQAKDLALEKSVTTPPFTSRVTVSIGDTLVGGLRAKNLKGLIQRVMAQKDDLSRHLVAQLRIAATGYDKAQSWLGTFDPTSDPTVSDREVFMTLLNLAIQSQFLYEEKAFGQVRLSSATKSAVKSPPGGEKLWALNRALLAEAFPDEVNADDARK